MNLTNWKYHSSKLPKSDPVAMAKYSEELQKEFGDEIRNNPEKYKDFFEGCYPSSIEQFIKNYAYTKMNIIADAEFYLSYTNENRELKYQSEANEIFDLILQKKLFDIQVQWRAETLEIPQVRLCADFIYWEERIRDCPFLDTVTEAEVRVMEQFLKSNNFSDQTKSWLCYWQDAREIREKDEEGRMDMYPEWYDFYDGRMGTGALQLLPDVRGEKEWGYIHLLMDEAQKERELNPPPPTVSMRIAHTDHNTMHEFIQTYDDVYFKTISDGYLNSNVTPNAGMDEYDDDVATAYYLLQDANEPVYMPGGMHWKEAIVKCAQQYKNNKIAEGLDAVFEEYMMLKEAGIGWGMEDYTEEYRKKGICMQMENNIIKARLLCGEEGNLNF